MGEEIVEEEGIMEGGGEGGEGEEARKRDWPRGTTMHKFFSCHCQTQS